MTEETGQPWTLYRPIQRWIFLAILFLVSLSNYVDRQIVAVLIEPIKREFGASDTMMGLLGGFAFAAFYAVLGIPVARLADRGDRKLVISVSLAIWSVMTMLCGMAQNFTQLLLARVGVGVGEAGAIPPAQSLIADYFPPEQRARALGIFLASAMGGYLIAFTLGARLAVTHGWRTAFLVLGAPGLMLCILAWTGLSEPRRRFKADDNQPVEPLRETVAALAHNRTFVLLCIAATLYWLVAYGAVIWFPVYLIRVLGEDLARAGATFGALSAIASLLGNVLGGIIADVSAKRGIRAAAQVPGALLILAAPLFEISALSSNFPIFYVTNFLGGLLLAAVAPAIFTLLHRVCGSERRAMAVAIMFFFANLLGLGCGPLITGALSDLFTDIHGPIGLRYALLGPLAMLIPAGVVLYLSARSIEIDCRL